MILHGYPTSSYDFREIIPFLEEDYFVTVLDFPGFGFSDKPQEASEGREVEGLEARTTIWPRVI